MPALISEEEFKEKAKDGISESFNLRKSFIAEAKAVAGDSRVIDFVISTASVDRMGDTIAVDGWKLANYRKNPVVLWSHDPSVLPVAKASNIRVEDGVLKASAEFMPREISGFSDAVYQAIKQGFLNAVSVGFAPIKYAFSEESGRMMGMDFIEQELLEFSVVGIPANPEALVQMRSAGIDTKGFEEWAEKLLAAAGKITLPKAQYDAIMAVPKEFNAIAKKIKDSPGARGTMRRCANIVERIFKADTSEWKMGASRTLPIDMKDAWDGNAAASRMFDHCGMDGESPDLGMCRKGFLAYDAANPTLKGSYKLPIADIIGGEMKAVAGGIRAAASRLPQTDIPESVRAEAQTVIDDYEKKMEGMKHATPRRDRAKRRLELLQIQP